MTMTMPKTLHNTDPAGLVENVPDVQVFGNPDAWITLAKASSETEGWMNSTKAMNVSEGVLVQTRAQQRNPDGSYALSEALQYVPGAKVVINEFTGERWIDSRGEF